jgi:DNA-binding NarL/FixJ family response regulator
MVLEKKIFIYIADSNSEYRNSFKESLKNAQINAKIFSFDSEKKLMNSLGQSTASPDIIFLTFDLENETTITCLKLIRLKRKFSDVPVVVFSPFTYLKDIKSAFDNGASLFIPKPIYMENSTKALQAIFRPRWRHHLIQPNSYKFVLSFDTEDTGKLCWSAS